MKKFIVLAVVALLIFWLLWDTPGFTRFWGDNVLGFLKESGEAIIFFIREVFN